MPRELLARAAAACTDSGLVPSDPRTLKPGELVKLLNSTPLGEVLDDRTLRAHRARAGYRVGDGKSIDLFRYVGWLFWQRRAKGAEGKGEGSGFRVQASGGRQPAGDFADSYEAKKERERSRNAAASEEGRDVAAEVEACRARINHVRRLAGEANLRVFCETYFPARFMLAWSRDHLTVLDRLQEVTLDGGLYALAMPRGSGKTTICEAAGLWAALTGRRRFVLLIGASRDAATEIIDALKAELEHNELLAEDFPEVCIPIQRIQSIANRCKGQHYRGERTRIEWSARHMVFPTIPGSQASGAIVRVAGITGRIRGMRFERSDGEIARPDLAIIDDPQTDASANSELQCKKRKKVLSGAVLGLAGPGKKIAALMPCTVIRRGDVADEFLDRTKRPQWNGHRFKLVNAFPTNEKRWQQFGDELAESLRRFGDNRLATAFYEEHRAAMDEGADVPWEHRFEPGQLSALQYAMELRLADEGTFFAEYQNEPLVEDLGTDKLPTADQLAVRLNGVPRRVVPIAAPYLTCFIDVQQTVLYWIVAAWSADFSGGVVDYGTFPDQELEYFTLRDVRRTLADVFPRAGLEGRIYAGLEALTQQLLDKEWQRENRTGVRINRCAIDANWGQSTDTVYNFCRGSRHAAILLPSHGAGISAKKKPFNDYKPKPGDQLGHAWRIPIDAGKRGIRHLLFDANTWKSFVFARLMTAVGDRGALTLFGQAGQNHRMLCEHLASEYRIRTSGHGREVDEWELRPDASDNHFLDGLVGTAVLASLAGAVLPAIGPASKPAGPPIKFSEIAKAKQAERRRG